MKRVCISLVVCMSLLAAVSQGFAHPLVLKALQFGGSYLAGKGLDYVFFSDDFDSDQQRLDELGRRLVSYEESLRQVDAELADQIRSFRADLSSRTTIDQVRKVVQTTTDQLSLRIQRLEESHAKLEVRQDRLEGRVAELESIFGRIPEFTPAPLLSFESEPGKPSAHPLTLEWLRLLSASEANRIKLAELRRTFQETSPVIDEAINTEKELLSAIRSLHLQVTHELARGLAKRDELLKVYKPDTLPLLKCDDELGAMMWLAAVTRPISDGPHRGRLGVPSGLLSGPKASDVLVALRLAGGNSDLAMDLFRRDLAGEADRTGAYYARVDPALLNNDTRDQAISAARMVVEASTVAVQARNIQVRLDSAKSQFSPSSDQVQAVQAEKRSHLASIENLSERLRQSVDRVLADYLHAVERERPTTPRMQSLRRSIILPMMAWEALFRIDLQDAAGLADEVRWQRVVSGDQTYLARRVIKSDAAQGGLLTAMSSDGLTLTTCTRGGRLIHWKVADGRMMSQADTVADVESIGPGGEILMYRHGPALHLWNGTDNAMINNPFSGKGVNVIWSLSGRSYVVIESGAEAKVRHYNWAHEKIQVATYQFPSCAAVSPLDDRVAVGTEGGEFVVHDVRGGKEVLRRQFPSPVVAIAYGASGNLAVACAGGMLYFLEPSLQTMRSVRTGEQLNRPKLAFSPNSRTLAIAEQTRITFWEVQSDVSAGAITTGSNTVEWIGFGVDGYIYWLDADGVTGQDSDRELILSDLMHLARR